MKKLFSGLLKKSAKRPFCSAIVAAAGSSARMGGENKLLLPLGDMPVLARTLLALERAECIDEIVIAARESELLAYADLCKAYGITKSCKVVCGGATRVESVLRACMEANPKAELLAVQDGARPLVTPELINDVVRAAARCGAAAPAVSVQDTIKVAKERIVCSTPERATLFAIQTPQVFDASLLKAALQSAWDEKAEITDDCSAVERLGKEVYLTEGSRENIKITTPVDLVFARAILEERGEA